MNPKMQVGEDKQQQLQGLCGTGEQTCWEKQASSGTGLQEHVDKANVKTVTET